MHLCLFQLPIKKTNRELVQNHEVLTMIITKKNVQIMQSNISNILLVVYHWSNILHNILVFVAIFNMTSRITNSITTKIHAKSFSTTVGTTFTDTNDEGVWTKYVKSFYSAPLITSFWRTGNIFRSLRQL